MASQSGPALRAAIFADFGFLARILVLPRAIGLLAFKVLVPRIGVRRSSGLPGFIGERFKVDHLLRARHKRCRSSPSGRCRARKLS